jgi:hypothetical protein
MSTALAGLSWVVRPRNGLPAGQADAHPRPSRRSFDLRSRRPAGDRNNLERMRRVPRTDCISTSPSSVVRTSREFFLDVLTTARV